MNTQKKLSIEISEKKFSKVIFENVNIDLYAGNCYALVGLNGSGKTTLINTVTGLDKRFTGEINYTNGDLRKNMFYIPSDFYIPDYLTGQQYYQYLCTIYEKENNAKLFENLLDVFDMTDASTELMASYSFGMKKKIQFICAVCIDQEINIFDEITSGLDVGTILLIENIINLQKDEKIYLIATHDFDFSRACADKTYLIWDKKVEDVDSNVRKSILELGIIDDKLKTISEIL